MKQSAKTLGVTALGAAFAAAGAGAANAAPAVPDTTQALGGVSHVLPLAEHLAEAVPGGAGDTVTHSKETAEKGLTTAQPVAQQLAEQQLSQGPTAPVAGLLGGLPLQGLPTHGLPVNGLPLG
ncbi:hypothetical protein GCM10010129_19930 [Streptomyces fumigatiscleroticus]|nr:hypothetical protein GCM10010129_19930 [Streptomyces fumigatiscleroticus]